MAKKLPELTNELTELSDNDLIHAVDVSDPTEDVTGSSGKVKVLSLKSTIGVTQGIPEWSSTVNYNTGYLAREAGTTNIYYSSTDGNLNNNLTDPGNWQLWLGSAAFLNTGVVDGTIPLIGAGDKLLNSILNEATESLAGIKKLATQLQANDISNNSTVLTPQKLHGAILGIDLLETREFTNETSVDFDALPIANYSDFELIVKVTPSNNASNFSIRLSNNNGGVWQAADYRYALSGRHSDGGSVTNQDNSDAQIILNDNGGGNQVGNQATSTYNATIRCYNLASTTKYKQLDYDSTYSANNNNRTVSISGNGEFFGNTQAVNGIQLFFDAGTFDGTIKLYGIK